MSELDDIDEADIPDLPDEVLEREVAAWVEHTIGRDSNLGEKIQGSEYRWNEDNTLGWPAYTDDPAAAWCLLTCGNVSINPPNVNRKTTLVTGYKHHAVGTKKEVTVGHEDPKRALVECAATLAIRGVESRETP